MGLKIGEEFVDWFVIYLFIIIIMINDGSFGLTICWPIDIGKFHYRVAVLVGDG